MTAFRLDKAHNVEECASSYQYIYNRDVIWEVRFVKRVFVYGGLQPPPSRTGRVTRCHWEVELVCPRRTAEPFTPTPTQDQISLRVGSLHSSGVLQVRICICTKPFLSSMSNSTYRIGLVSLRAILPLSVEVLSGLYILVIANTCPSTPQLYLWIHIA